GRPRPGKGSRQRQEAEQHPRSQDEPHGEAFPPVDQPPVQRLGGEPPGPLAQVPAPVRNRQPKREAEAERDRGEGEGALPPPQSAEPRVEPATDGREREHGQQADADCQVSEHRPVQRPVIAAGPFDLLSSEVVEGVGHAPEDRRPERRQGRNNTRPRARFHVAERRTSVIANNEPVSAPLRRALVLHPFLLAAYPVVYLWAHNLREGVAVRDVVVPLAIAIGAATLLTLAGTLVLRNGPKAGLVV